MSDFIKRQRQARGLSYTEDKDSQKTTEKEASQGTSSNTQESFVEKHRKARGLDYGDVDANYISSFLYDAQKYSRQYEADSKNMSWETGSDEARYKARSETSANLSARARKIRAYLNKNKDLYGGVAYSQLVSYLDGFSQSNTAISAQNKRLYEYYSQFESGDHYFRTATDTEARKQRQQWYTDSGKRIEELEAEKKRLQSSNQATNYSAGSDTSLPLIPIFDNPNSDKIKAIDAEIEDLKSQRRQYERGEGGFATTKELDDYHLTYMTDEDFVEAGGYRDYGNSSATELMQYKELNDVDTWTYETDGTIVSADGTVIVEDGKGGYINPDSYGMNTVNDRLGLFLTATEEEKQMAIGTSMGTWRDIYVEGSTKHWDLLTEDEITIYYGLRKTQGEEAANKFLENIQLTLDQRATYGYIESYAEQYDEANLLGKILLNAAAIPAQLASALTGTVDFAASLVTGEEINPYSAAHGGMHYANTIYGETAEDVDKLFGSKEGDLYTWGDAYQALTSGITSMVANTLGPFGPVLLGMGAFQSEVYERYQQGASTAQIALSATAAAAAEFIFEKLTLGELDKIKNIKSPETLAQFFKVKLIQQGVEMSEEAATELANIVSEAFIFGTQSDVGKILLETDGNWGAVIKEKGLDIIRAGIGGFISGGLSGGLVAGSSYVSNLSSFAKTGGEIIDAGSVDPLKTLAMEVSGGKGTMEKQANAVKSDSTSLGNRIKVGRLYQTVSKSTFDMNRSGIVTALVNNGIDKKDAGDIADAMIAKFSGWDLTPAQNTMLARIKDNAAVKAAVESVVANTDSDMGKRTQQQVGAVSETKQSAATVSQEEIVPAELLAERDAIARELVELEEHMFSAENSNRTWETHRDEIYAESSQLLRLSAKLNEVNAKISEYKAGKQFTGKLEDGKGVSADDTFQESSGESIQVKRFSSVGTADATVVTESGKDVKLSDVSFGKEGEAVLLQSIPSFEHITTEAANTILQAYRMNAENGPATGFTAAAAHVFKSGYYNSMPKQEYSSRLTDSQRDLIYEAGRNAARAEADAKQAEVDAKKKTTAKKKAIAEKKGGVFYEYDGKRISEREDGEHEPLKKAQRVAVDFTERLAKKFGSTVYFYESYEDADGNRVYKAQDGSIKPAKKGFYNPEDGSIHIDLNGDNILFTVSHELVHFIRDWSPKQFQKMADVIMEGFNRQGVAVEELIANKQAEYAEDGIELTEEEAFEEVVAASMEGIMADGRVVELLQKIEAEDKSLGAKVRRFFQNIAQMIRDTIDSYKGVKPGSAEGRLIQKMEDIYSQLQEVFAEAVSDAGETFRQTENTTGEGGVRYSISGNFYEQLDNWDEKTVGFAFTIGDTSEALQKAGMPKKKIKWDATKIKALLTKHSGMSLKTVRGVPELLEHPIIIIDSKQNDNSRIVMGELYDEKGKVVTVVLLLTPTSKKGNVLDIIKISSAEGRSHIRSLFTHEDGTSVNIRYVDKNRIQSWLNVNRLQLPLHNLDLDSNTSIVNSAEIVKEKSTANSDNKKSTSSTNIRYAVGSKMDKAVQGMLEKENAKLREDVAQLKELLKLQGKQTHGTKFTASSVEAAARYLKRNAGAKGDTTALVKLLNGFYGHIAASEDLTWEGVREQARVVANWLMDHVVHTRSTYAQEVLDQIRGSRIRLDKSQMAEAAHIYESFDAYRKSLMGSITIAKNASTSLDSWWQEMATLYPDVFDSEISASDMPGELADIIYRMRNENSSALEYEYNRRMIEQELTREVYDSYWRVTSLRTVADRNAAQVNKLKSEHYQRLNSLKAENRQKTEQIKEQHRAAVKTVRDAYRQKMESKIKAVSSKYQESRKKAVESRGKTVVRHKIQRVVGELNQLLLSNDKKRHVPDNLKKAVADALSLVNMDTVAAEERAAKYAALIAEETDQDKIDAYTVTMENILRQGEKMGQRIKDLRDAYEDIRNSHDPDIANAYDPVIAESLIELSQTIGNTSLRDMSIDQLEDVYTMFKMVLTRVRDANKAIINGKNESIRNLAAKVVEEVKKTGGEHKYRAAILDPARSFFWNNTKPVYAMEHIGSKTMTEAYDNVRKGEDTWANDMMEARAFYTDMAKKYEFDSWNFDEKHGFESASGLPFELTLEQILSLYAYSKREQAHDHLRLGGFVFDSNIETTKGNGSKLIKYKVNTADAHQITPEILADITDTLTEEQRAFVDEMQAYLSDVMGAKGNEVTMKMYGVKLFKEKFYFPLKSAKQFMFEQNEVAGEVKIKNSGFTNKVVAKANNPVILSNFTDVWANHVNDMSMYHAFVLPLEDFNRIFNYNSPKQDGVAPVSVKGTIQSAYSPAAVNYVKQLITDLNGGAMADPRETLAKSLLAKFKKAKVFSSLSVVIQQPSAIGRAFALVDPKWFRPTADGMNHDQLWAEVKKYAPVAVIKEMGYFDTSMGRSAVDFIKAKEYSSFLEKAKAIFTDSAYRDELLSRAPALADELTWCAIWNAVKRETLFKHTDMKPGSEELLRVAGERFTEVITKTQVYDSVLARSANMRSKSGMMSMITSFMAEPTTTINMLEDAVRKRKRGNKKYAARAFASVAFSIILNNALASIVYGMRDDDEDETFAEKYAQAFISGLLDDINPLTYYPFMKDMWSVLQGYDVERSDMSLVSDFVDAMKGIVKAYTSENGDVPGAWWNAASAIANLGGIPIQNISRDVKGAINFYGTIAQDASGRATTWGSLLDAIESAVRDTLPVVGWLPGESKLDKLADAIISGDAAYVERMRAGYKDENSYNSAVRKALREAYVDGRIDEETTVYHLVKDAGLDGKTAVEKVNYWSFRIEWPQYKTLTEGDVANYYDYAEPAGVGIDVYAKYYDLVTSGMKKTEVLLVIHSLDISPKQKDALYFAKGYAKNTLDEAPWH